MNEAIEKEKNNCIEYYYYYIAAITIFSDINVDVPWLYFYSTFSFSSYFNSILWN